VKEPDWRSLIIEIQQMPFFMLPLSGSAKQPVSAKSQHKPQSL
jgi:hypothetical protein